MKLYQLLQVSDTIDTFMPEFYFGNWEAVHEGNRPFADLFGANLVLSGLVWYGWIICRKVSFFSTLELKYINLKTGSFERKKNM